MSIEFGRFFPFNRQEQKVTKSQEINIPALRALCLEVLINYGSNVNGIRSVQTPPTTVWNNPYSIIPIKMISGKMSHDSNNYDPQKIITFELDRQRNAVWTPALVLHQDGRGEIVKYYFHQEPYEKDHPRPVGLQEIEEWRKKIDRTIRLLR